MNILITGGCGFIGSHTVVELLALGHNVTIVDSLINSSVEVTAAVEKVSGKKVDVHYFDVRDENKLDKVFAKSSFDAVIHFAGLKAVGESCAKPLYYYDNNIGSTITLLKVMKRHSVNKLIFSSSATVYGVPKKLPLDESQPLSTTNPYGATKLMQENMLRDIASSDDSLCVILLRYFNPVGAHSSGLMGEDPSGIPNNLMPYISRVAIGSLEKLTIYGGDYDTPDGTGVRDYLHVVDLALGHVAALEKVSEAGVHTYNLGTGVGYSVLDMVHSFERACGKKIPYVIGDRRAGDVASCYADASLAKAKLGWVAERTLDDMCASSWNWQSKNPNGYKTKK